VEEEDWFGEGNAFESGEELASALLAMAEHPAMEAAAASVPEPAVLTAPGTADSFHLVDGRNLAPVAARAPLVIEAVKPQRAWAVRSPGAVALPPRAPGRSGWTIRNSVKVLQHTEEILDALREEAVVATLRAASRALHPDTRLPKRKAHAR